MGLRSAAGTFVATGAGTSILATHGFNVSLWGTFVANVQLERSFDNGATWLPVTYADGTGVQWTAPVSTPFDEPEDGVLQRLNCVGFTSGTVNWRISL